LLGFRANACTYPFIELIATLLAIHLTGPKGDTGATGADGLQGKWTVT
jgi:hypothetical protein